MEASPVVGPNDSLTDAWTHMLNASVQHLPVVDEGRLAGILAATDIVDLIAASSAELRDTGVLDTLISVGDRMHADVVTLGPDDTLDDAIVTFSDHRFHALPVVDGGRVVGMLSSLHLLEALLSHPVADVPPEAEISSEASLATLMSDHETIRQYLLALAAHAARGGSDDVIWTHGLVRSCSDLLLFLVEHMAREEKALEPILLERFEDGDVRMARLYAHHREQRRELLDVLHALQSPAARAGEVRAAIHALTRELLSDMAREDDELMRADVFGTDGSSAD